MKNFLLLSAVFIFCRPLEAQQNEDQDLVARTLERVNQFKINNQNDSALYELTTLNRLLISDGRESGYIYIEMGNIYFLLKLDNMARTFYRKADELFHQHNDLIGQSIVLENYGSLFNREHPNNDTVRYYFERALALQQKANDPFYSAHSLRSLALFYSYNDNSKAAHRLLNQAIRSVRKPGIKKHPRYAWDVQFIPQQVYLTASEIYRYEKKKPDSAEYFLKEAIRMTKIYGIEAHRVRYTTFLSTYYMEQRQYPKALKAIRESLALADTIGYVWGKVGALQALKNYYHQTKDKVKETEAAYNYLLYKDKMYNENNNDELIVMTNLILQYENEREIERQQILIKEKERVNQYQQRQNYLLLAITLVFALGLLIIVILYRRLQLKTKLAERYLSELETSNDTMRNLLSVISHDVRAPFNSLLGLSKITLMESALSNEAYRERVSMMHDASAKGLILLDNLLQWVAVQRDKALIVKEDVDVPALISETLNELSSVALTQNVTIEKNIEATHVTTDRNALKVIVRNLLTNAIKYSSGKKIVLTISANPTIISVTDQGPGIPPDILEGLFTSRDMKKVAAKGSGLGLLIVTEMVVKLGGDIHAQNLVEGGARFEVQLPL
ncbi:MAG: HAMP domain-containing histidine kinase [Bacteroidetes bacterium]|nr:HAMP domain-containing histidine kinase [Bacteroidota bacterium]